ncbi:hypothetical protein Hanom_Chr10g00878651 [Helianthus anomalus]
MPPTLSFMARMNYKILMHEARFAGAILGCLAMLMVGLMIVKMKTHHWVCKMVFKTQMPDGVEKPRNMAKVINSRWVGSKWACHFNAQKGN